MEPREAPAGRETPSAPDDVKWIVRHLEAHGFESWAVGGAVRDAVLGRPSSDWDLATRATPKEVRRLFSRTVPIGIDHGTVGVLTREGKLIEVTTFRRDIETFGRHAVVEFAETLDEDLSRRDFTINAIAWHPLREELRDPFDGAGDLERGVLRTVGSPQQRLAEDYLRVLRALRFAGRFRLTIDSETWSAIEGAVEGLGQLSSERVREEFMKVLEGDPDPERALDLWAQSGALERLMPELAALVDLPSADGDGKISAWTFGAQAAGRISTARPWVRLTALAMEAGLPDRAGATDPAEVTRTQVTQAEVTQADAGQGHPPGSGRGRAERARARMAALMTRLRFSNAATDRVAGNVGVPVPDFTPPFDGADLRRTLAAMGRERLPDLIRSWGARARVSEALGRSGPGPRITQLARALRSEVAKKVPLTVDDLMFNGRDLIRLGFKPGPHFKQILAGLLDEVLEDPGRNDPSVLEDLVLRQGQKGP